MLQIYNFVNINNKRNYHIDHSPNEPNCPTLLYHIELLKSKTDNLNPEKDDKWDIKSFDFIISKIKQIHSHKQFLKILHFNVRSIRKNFDPAFIFLKSKTNLTINNRIRLNTNIISSNSEFQLNHIKTDVILINFLCEK